MSRGELNGDFSNQLRVSILQREERGDSLLCCAFPKRDQMLCVSPVSPRFG